MYLAAFDVSPSIVGIPRGKLSVEAERMLSLRSSLSSLLPNWLEMEVILLSVLNSSSADIVIAMESEFKFSNLQGANDVIARCKKYLPGTLEG